MPGLKGSSRIIVFSARGGMMDIKKEKEECPVLPGLLNVGARPDHGDGYLIGSKCRTCGRVFFPRCVACLVCMTETVEEIPLSRRGTIDTFTVVHVAPIGFKPPYIQAFVDLPEGPRIFSLITGCDPLKNDLKEGAPVEIVIEKVREDEKGNDLIGYKFRPIGQ